MPALALALLLVSAAPPRSLEGLALGQGRAAALALPLWGRLCASPPACAEAEQGSRCRCQGPGPVQVELDFAGPGEAGALARATLRGPDLAWAQKLAYQATAQGEYRELRCPDLAGYALDSGPGGELLVGDAAGRGLVELRALEALPAAWGQRLPPQTDQPLPPLALARPALETDWYGLELRPHLQLGLGAPGPRPGWAVQGEGGPPLDGLRLGALHRADRWAWGYGLGWASGWLREPLLHYTLVGASGEAMVLALSPADRVRPLAGAELGLDYARSRPAGADPAARLAPWGALRAGALLTLAEAVALRLGASYTLSPAPPGPGPSVRPGGLALELGLVLGLGTEVSAHYSRAQLQDAQARGYLGRTDRRLASMRGLFQPYGVVYPVREFTRVRLPAGTYRLTADPGLELAGARPSAVEDYGDSFRVADADGRVVLFLEQAGPVSLHARLPCLAQPRAVRLERLDYGAWRLAHPELAAEPEP